MTSTCPTGASPSPGTPGELTYRALRAWLGHRRTAWPRTPNQHVLISEKTAFGTESVSQGFRDHERRVDRPVGRDRDRRIPRIDVLSRPRSRRSPRCW